MNSFVRSLKKDLGNDNGNGHEVWVVTATNGIRFVPYGGSEYQQAFKDWRRTFLERMAVGKMFNRSLRPIPANQIPRNLNPRAHRTA